MNFQVYTDGSFRDDRWAAGYVIIDDDGKATEFSRTGTDNISERNVTGEINAVIHALRDVYKFIEYSSEYKKKYELEKKANPAYKPTVEIYYDYEGIGKWISGEWKAKKELTQNYVNTVAKASAYLDIKFTKVKAHAGVGYNELADKLARSALDCTEEQGSAKRVVCLELYMDNDTYNELAGENGIAEMIERNVQGVRVKAV